MAKTGRKRNKDIDRLNINEYSELDVITSAISDVNLTTNLRSKKKNKKIKEKMCPITPTIVLSDLDRIFQTLDRSELCIRKSRKFITLVNGNKDYKCSLCKTVFTYKKNLLQLRFRIWTHLNEQIHKKNLEGYEEEINIEYKNIKKTLSKEIIGELKDDVKFFEIGPIERFLTCTLCNCAVSCNVHRLKNHLEDKYHIKNKLLAAEIVEAPVAIPIAIPITRNLQGTFLDVYCKDYSHQRLVSNLPLDLKCEEKYILVANIPGYLVCYLCCKPILPTPFYLESHLRDLWHRRNKCTFSELTDSKPSEFTDVKFTLNRPLSKFCMDIFISVVNSDDSELKSNAKFIFKDYCGDEYSCQLCNISFQTYESHLLIEEFKLHFTGSKHQKNVSVQGNVLLKEDNTIFPLFADFPEELYEDIRFISIPPPQKNIQKLFCTLCDYSVASDLNMLMDHIQSNTHNKKKTLLKISKDVDCSKEIDFSDKINKVFEKLSKTFQNMMCEKEFFIKDESGSNFICQVCCTTVGNFSSNITGLEKIITQHITQQRHKENSSRFLKRVTKEKKRKTLEELFNKLPNVWKHDRKFITVSKDQLQLKCKACKEKFPMDIQHLLDHIKIKDHVDNVLAKVSGSDSS